MDVRDRLSRSERDLLDKLRREAVDGPVRLSASAVARELGYSRTTIYRGLKRLQELGFINYTPAERVSDAGFIEVRQDEIRHSLLSEGAKAREDARLISELAGRCVDYLTRTLEMIDQYEKEMQEYRNLLSRVESRTISPDGRHEILKVRRNEVNSGEI